MPESERHILARIRSYSACDPTPLADGQDVYRPDIIFKMGKDVLDSNVLPNLEKLAVMEQVYLAA
jgi:hypothetical protein